MDVFRKVVTANTQQGLPYS